MPWPKDHKTRTCARIAEATRLMFDRSVKRQLWDAVAKNRGKPQ